MPIPMGEHQCYPQGDPCPSWGGQPHMYESGQVEYAPPLGHCGHPTQKGSWLGPCNHN